MNNIKGQLRQRNGFTLIELAVMVCVVAILAGTLLNRVLFYQEQAEKAAMEQTVGALRSALTLQAASLVAKGKENEIPRLLKQNPINWLADKPANYLGEYFAPKPQDIESGSWYFDLQSGNLIYSVRHGSHFRIGTNDTKNVHFRTRLVTAPEDRRGDKNKQIEGVILEPVVPYKWF